MKDGEEMKLDHLFQLNKDWLGYLASPYTAQSKELMHRRYEAITDLAAKLFKAGMILICPITQSVAIVEKSKTLKSCWNTWKRVDLEFVNRCDFVIVADFPGWDRSVGVLAELEYAASKGKHIVHLTEDDPIIEHLIGKYKLNEDL